MAPYPHLLSPLRIAGHTLPNRMVMGAMHTRLETLDNPLQRLAAFYARRAQGEISLILTGGYSPTPEGVMDEGGLYLNHPDQLADHKIITTAVRQAGGRIVLQILHAGRYARVANCVAPSALKARINSVTPRALTEKEIQALVEHYANTAELAERAGYAGVEIMGSEGYLINQFTSALTNQRTDAYGGNLERRVRFPLDIVRAVKARLKPDTLIIYRISAIDLMEGGMTAGETAELARQVEQAGAHLLNTGIGWHESAVPTIAAAVPRAAWADAVRAVKQAVSIPVMASNRINTPELAEHLLATGAADLVSMARPLLADPDFALKTRQNRAREINTCIACNQACLDHIFTERTATCLVNPVAGRETEFKETPASPVKRIAVIGGGAAGMAFAVQAAQRGHHITLFEAGTELGGQLNLARQVPGKSEFNELLRYFRVMLDTLQVDVRLNTRVTPATLQAQPFDDVVLATGVTPRTPNLPGINHPKVIGYTDALSGRKPVGNTVAILGAGGIGFDVAEFVTGDAQEALDPAVFMRRWGVNPNGQAPGGLDAPEPVRPTSRTVHLFQRTPGSPGKHLGKSTGWILKAKLRKAGVRMVSGVHYTAIDDHGLHYTLNGEPHTLNADTLILCTGQEPENSLLAPLRAAGYTPHLIGGAERAGELDALRAIDQATRLAHTL